MKKRHVTSQINTNNLAILVSCPATIRDNVTLYDSKAIAGIKEYIKYWKGGRVVAIFRLDKNVSPQYFESVSDRDLSSTLRTCETEEEILCILEECNTILLAADNHKDLKIFQKICKQKLKTFFVIEYNLKTRLQIVNLENKGNIAKLKSVIWNLVTEIRRRQSLKNCSGFQANGLPAMSAYQNLNKSSFVYFDTRVTSPMLATPAEMQSRFTRYKNSNAIELVFSGRLENMKGASDLPLIAKKLRDMGVRFNLHIFGDGTQRPQIEKSIQALQLDSYVKMHGAVNFKDELVPFIRENVDLFVCTHKQSDPSCTYLETFACGVPIIGYSNEALDGLRGLSHSCWSVQSGNVTKLAEQIASLSALPDTLQAAASNALAFAKQHTFEKEFYRRVNHLSSEIA